MGEGHSRERGCGSRDGLSAQVLWECMKGRTVRKLEQDVDGLGAGSRSWLLQRFPKAGFPFGFPGTARLDCAVLYRTFQRPPGTMQRNTCIPQEILEFLQSSW